MSWQKWVTIDDGVFEGTLDQYRETFSDHHASTIEQIVDWWAEHGLSVEIQDRYLFPIVGYGNKTAMHPLGSYIGFERGPTVFASPLTHVSIAESVVTTLQHELEDLQADVELLQQTTPRAVFKQIVTEAMKPNVERSNSATLMSCSIPSKWFKPGGKYHGLIDKIDEMLDETIVPQMAWFIADCYQQR